MCFGVRTLHAVDTEHGTGNLDRRNTKVLSEGTRKAFAKACCVEQDVDLREADGIEGIRLEHWQRMKRSRQVTAGTVAFRVSSQDAMLNRNE